MKLTPTLINRLEALLEGRAVPCSALRGVWVDELCREGLLARVSQGSRGTYRTTRPEALRNYLPRLHEALRDLDAARQMLRSGTDTERSAQVALTGNSKVQMRRTFQGFLVNTLEPLPVSLNGQAFSLQPPEGSFVFISDWETFCIPPQTVVVGIENCENFRHIARQRRLFDAILQPGEAGLLFLSRYPQSQSHDLRQWLQRIPNRYVHFGDFDLAGIHIFLTEFQPYLGQRASFLIPHDIEERLAHGSRQRYDDQWERFRHLTTDDDRLNHLISLIHRHRRGYDQEGYIEAE